MTVSKLGRVRVSTQLLQELLRLEGRILEVHQDHHLRVHGAVELILDGVGREVREGEEIPFISLEEARETLVSPPGVKGLDLPP